MVRKSQAMTLAARACRNAGHDDCPRPGAGWRPASSSTLRTDVADTATPTPFNSHCNAAVAPIRILATEPKDQLPPRRVERRPARLRVRVGPAAGDELPVPAQQRLRPDAEVRLDLPGQPAAQRRQQRAVSPLQRRPRCLPAQDRQLMPQNQDLQPLRAAPTRKQPHQPKQAPHGQLDERPQHAALPRPRPRAPNLASPNQRTAATEFANPTGEPHKHAEDAPASWPARARGCRWMRGGLGLCGPLESTTRSRRRRALRGRPRSPAPMYPASSPRRSGDDPGSRAGGARTSAGPARLPLMSRRIPRTVRWRARPARRRPSTAIAECGCGPPPP
jgi:hypothetical protein